METARPEQLQPEGDWRFWYLRGGRGSGKSRTGAETLADWILNTETHGEASNWAVVAPSFGDARKICVEGTSGLLKALGSAVAKYNSSTGEMWVKNGARVVIDGADDGAKNIQGENLRGAWCDEVGLWANGWEKAWKESLRLAVRFAPARIVATGTPKTGHPLVRLLLNHPRCVTTHMRTLDNAANLDRQWLDEMISDLEGSRLGRQELEGEFLDEPLGALWTLSQLEALRVVQPAPLSRVVVGVDPSGTPSEDTGVSETGIVVAGWSADVSHAYVLADASLHASPDTWGRQVVDAYYGAYTGGIRADVVVAEKNFGGELVRSNIHSVDPNVPVRMVNASRNKAQRAEPVAAKYEQGRVHHVGEMSRLEEQMCSFIPGDTTQQSPDRMDALVWALTELMIDKRGASNVVYREMPGQRQPYRRGDYTSPNPHEPDKPSLDVFAVMREGARAS